MFLIDLKKAHSLPRLPRNEVNLTVCWSLKRVVVGESVTIHGGVAAHHRTKRAVPVLGGSLIRIEDV